MTVSAYSQRVNAANLAAQHATVQATAREILKELRAVEDALYWALDPEEKYPLDWCRSLIERAHALVDMGHEYRLGLVDHPPPKMEDNEEENTGIT